MKKRLTTKALKWKLDVAFSKLIRARDEFMPCISCGKFCHGQLQAGHFVKREILSTRWHPWNVSGECQGCNHFNSSHLVGYSIEIEKRFGKPVREELFRLSRIRWKVLPDQLERLLLATGSIEDYESEWAAVQKEFDI